MTHVALVFGGRDYRDRAHVFRTLDALEPRPTLVIHGACGWDRSKPDAWQPGRLRGADRWAHEWAIERGIPVVPMPADWTKHGRRAGPLRNREMRDRRPDVGVGFPGGSGTASMRRLLLDARIPCMSVAPEAQP